MSWIAVGIAAAGAIAGKMNADAQRSQKNKELQANAEAIKMSPWSGMKPTMEGMGNTPTGAMGAMQGGLAGAMMGSQFSKASAATPDSGNAVSGATAAAADPSANALGGQDMSNKLGAQSSQFQAGMQQPGQSTMEQMLEEKKRNSFFASNPYVK